MSVAQSVRSLIEDKISSRQPVDIFEVANLVKADYPDHSLEEVTAIVEEVVVSAGGNAMWIKRATA